MNPEKTVMLKHYIVVVNECSRDYAYNNQICDYAYDSRIRDSCDNIGMRHRIIVEMNRIGLL